MGQLSHHQVVLITTAAVLLADNASALSDFECETIAEVGARFSRYRREAEVSTFEWWVIEDAVNAMRRHRDERRRLLPRRRSAA